MAQVSWSLLGGAAAALLLLFIRSASILGHRTRHMPPGPPTLPFIGNMHQIPRSYAQIKFTEWANKYGGLYMLKLGNANMAVVTDRRIVKEMSDRNSAAYSHRPQSYVSQELVTRGDHFLVMDYGDKWRTFRRLAHQYLTESMVNSKHLEIVNAEAIQMVRDFLVEPRHHMSHPKRYSNSITSSILYGIRTVDYKAKHMQRLLEMMDGWSQILATGATSLVDIFPWLKNIPERFLGSHVMRARVVSMQMGSLYADMLRRVEERREDGQDLGTFMDGVLNRQEKYGLTRHQLEFIGGVMMEGGSDTSANLILALVQALVENPDVQCRAHEEIDRVVGHTRSPGWEDLKNLPYINMIVKETHRWRPILPLGAPHALAEDDWIGGKFLPKGTTIIINNWGLHMDPAQQPKNSIEHRYDPARFVPERYADHPLLAPEYVTKAHDVRDHYGYGFCRRVCPAIHLAERYLLLGTAKLLWAFRMEVGEGGSNSHPVEGYHQGFVYHAKNYGCTPVVRSEEITKAIEREFETARKDVFSRFAEG